MNMKPSLGKEERGKEKTVRGIIIGVRRFSEQKRPSEDFQRRS